MNEYTKNISTFERDLKKKKEDYWIKRGENMALFLFRSMADRVPAYKDILKKNRINPKVIKTINDFQYLPTLDKNNYLRNYPIDWLCWDGKFKSNNWVISTTSGSTGDPFYFPRQITQDKTYALIAELYLRNIFQIKKKSIIYINGFAMGAWIGGLFTYQAIKYISEKNQYNISIISPGIFKNEIIKAVKNLGDRFDQIIIGGYPPMIKDMIDDAIMSGVKWEDYQLGFIFSAEGFSEKFRDYIISKTGLKNIYTSTLNHYGTVDLGTMAHETPLSIFLRRFLINNKSIYLQFFNSLYHLPTVTQYIPELYYFEENNNNLLCSSYSGVPLVRYDLKDKGGVYSLKAIEQKLSDNGIQLSNELSKVKIEKFRFNLPFVYVYERSDFIVKLYGANIYPETIRKALQESILNNDLTGKFNAQIKFDDFYNQYLEINIELKNNMKYSLKLEEKVKAIIIKYLLNENSEYRSNYREAPSRQIPRIIFWEYEHPKYFQPGIKQKWVNRQ